MAHDTQPLSSQRIQALFTLNTETQLVQVNEPNTRQITPRLYIMRTANAVVGHVRHDLDEALADHLLALVADEQPSDNFQQPLQHHEKYIKLLTSDAPVSAVISGPAYVLPDLSPSANAVIVDQSNLHMLAEHFPVTAEMYDFRNPIAAVVEDDIPVSVCFCARKTASVAEAGLFTAETHRRRGYALAVVSHWAHTLQQMDIQPLYSTSWDNVASQAVANRLGGTLYASDWSYR